MDPLWIIAAFVFGVVSGRMGLPPLVGYLIAGFMLNGFGVDGGELLGKIADIGVTLLLFTIGLKLKLKSLARPEVWAGTPIHMGITVAVFCSGILVLGMVGMPARCRGHRHPDYAGYNRRCIPCLFRRANPLPLGCGSGHLLIRHKTDCRKIYPAMRARRTSHSFRNYYDNRRL
jgi:hypothetical protein